MQEEQILCACSAYEQKSAKSALCIASSVIQDELQIMAVTMTEDVGGVFTIVMKMAPALYV